MNNTKTISRPSVNYLDEGYTPRPLTVGVDASVKF